MVAERLHILISEAKAKGVFEGIKVGTEDMEVADLQYADDAIFFGKSSLSNLKNLMLILRCFHELSGLKINLNKSKLLGVGVDENEARS